MRVLGLLAILVAGTTLPACGGDSCLGGEANCRVTTPCTALAYSCNTPLLELRTLDGSPNERPGGFHALGAKGDILLGNDQVVAVLSGLENQNYVDPGGGALLDLSNRGKDNDALGELITVVGILPDDSVHYDKMILLDERPTRVAVQLEGTLFHRPDQTVHTLYEIRPCEPGVRVRTEIWNGSPDSQLWALSDGAYWSGRNVLPFTPGPESGFVAPTFDILTIDNAFRDAPFLAASTHNGTDTSYSVTACNALRLNGFQSSAISSAGLPKQVVVPRTNLVYERFIAVAARPDIAGAADLAMGVRSQLFGERYTTLSGRVIGGGPGGPTDGQERHAAVQISERRGDVRIPWTEVVPAADGTFTAGVPNGADLVAELWVLGKKITEASPPADGSELQLSATPRIQIAVNAVDANNQPLDAELYVIPADDDTATAVTGTLFGQFDACSPWLGPPHGASPACNRVLVSRAAATTFDIPTGRFYVYGYHGPFYSLARVLVDTSVAQAPITLTLTALPLRPPGTVSADLHVHGAASFDSSIPDVDRVLSFAAADVDVIIATDHDVVGHYAETVTALGLDDRLTVVDGVETTGHVPAIRVPGDSFPRVIGHYNFWPLAFQPGLPRAGAPFDEFIEPGELFRRVDPLFTAPGIRQLNHPWSPSEFGRDLGFPRALQMNLLKPLPVADDGTNQGMYVRNGNGDHDTQEVMNGSKNDQFPAFRAFWFYLLDQGIPKTGTANSDSHSLTAETVGAPRNLVWTNTSAGPAFDVTVFNASLKAGSVVGTNGPVIEVRLVDGAGSVEHRPGMQPIQPSATAQLQLTVSAAPWVVVDEIRILVNGQVVKTLPATNPADPFGTTGLVRYDGMVALSELVTDRAHDAWLVVEAGARLPLVGDLGGGIGNAKDGVPDTADNNSDGVVDARDIASGEDIGPMNPPPAPDRSDVRWHFYQVVPGGYPLAFTNPFLLDLDGNGRFDGKGAR